MKEGFLGKAKEVVKKAVKTGVLIGATGAASFAGNAGKENNPIKNKNTNNTIEVNDAEDSRLKAYNDSNELYIKYRDHIQPDFNFVQTAEAIKESHDLMGLYFDNLFKKLDEKDVEILHKYGVDCKVGMPLDIKNSNYVKNESVIRKEMGSVLFEKMEENEKITSASEKDHLLGRLRYLFTSEEFIQPDPQNKPLTQFDFKEIDSTFEERGIKPVSWDKKEENDTVNVKMVFRGDYGDMWLSSDVYGSRVINRTIYSPKFKEPSIKVVFNENLKKENKIIDDTRVTEMHDTSSSDIEVPINIRESIPDTSGIAPEIKKENLRNPGQKHFFQGYSFIQSTGLTPGNYSIEEVNKALLQKGFKPIPDETKPESYFYYEVKKISDTEKTNNVLYSQK